MNVTIQRKTIWFSALFLSALFLGSCEKNEQSSIGRSIQPGEDVLGINQTDTFQLQMITYRNDSIPTDELSTNVLGDIQHPELGRMKAGFFAHVRLNSDNVTFGTAPVLDSVVLSLPISGYEGDTNSTIAFQVFEAAEKYYVDSVYYSNSSIQTIADPIHATSAPGGIKPSTRVIAGDDTLAPALRIVLKPSFGQRILDLPSGDLANNNAFLEVFKGIYVTAEKSSGAGNALLINPLQGGAGLILYYRNNNADSLQYTLPINAASARVNTFQFDYAGTDVQNQLTFPQSGSAQNYIQTGGGLKTRVLLPSLNDSLLSPTTVINKAELVLPAVKSVDDKLNPVRRFLVTALNEEFEDFIIPDVLEGEAHFDGFYNSIDNSYRVNITRYVQQVRSGLRPNNGIEIISANSGINLQGTIIAGTANVNRKPRLIVTFTTL